MKSTITFTESLVTNATVYFKPPLKPGPKYTKSPLATVYRRNRPMSLPSQMVSQVEFVKDKRATAKTLEIICSVARTNMRRKTTPLPSSGTLPYMSGETRRLATDVSRS